MRDTKDRIRHAILFEGIALAIIIPLGGLLFGLASHTMGVIALGSATVAMAWNYGYNLAFDHAMLRWVGHINKSVFLRIAHALLFEAGLLLILMPAIAWYLDITLLEAFVMDVAIAGFYVAYAFLFNLGYDHVFPVRSILSEREQPCT
ncbi:membrane protein [Azorhizobium oxalatiphilum]|uniref:Membrane protein n=1 Tax=Azorhizobium oxalatiphilum TaxID=980631 RepID=A0A917CLR2_9HYPH|nr:PACE efflux transporter [Azorhizobium oxalatiphilum]GGF89865.1 membrane protein [Azorhizobium oxalatiphilum]